LFYFIFIVFSTLSYFILPFILIYLTFYFILLFYFALLLFIAFYITFYFILFYFIPFYFTSIQFRLMSLYSSWYNLTMSHATAAFSGAPDGIW